MSLKFINLVGTPRERGRLHGEMMKSEIAASAEFLLNYICARGGNQEAVKAETGRWLSFLEKLAPEFVDELRGIAEASNNSMETVIMLNVRLEIAYPLLARQAIDLSYVVVDGCTSAGLMPEATSQRSTMLAQTIDGSAADCGTMFVGKIPGGDKPSLLGVFSAGRAGPVAGLNDAGLGLVCNGLLTAIDGKGPMSAPVTLRRRSILEARTLDRAIRVVVNRDPCTSLNYLIGHGEGEVISIETSPNARRCLYPEDGLITHANHFESGGNIVSEMERFVPDTLFRSRRFDRHLRSKLGAIDADHILAGLKDHFSYPASICLHPDSDPSHPQNSTLAAVIMDLNRLVLLATDGPPCGAPLQRFELVL
ncbi:C45 family autoproteolytic acyltransferase/hydolase [Bradyrhizobium japonicum]|nr:C45 family peptidase [Bradyrhizobium japonicum]